MIRLILIVIFAIIIFFASLIMLPVFWLIGKFNQDAKDRGSLRFVQGVFKVVLFLSGVTTTVKGLENLPKDGEAVLFVGNHHGFFDTIISYTYMKPRTGFVAKKEIEKVPLLNIWMKYLYCLFLDRKNMKEGLKTILTGIDYLQLLYSLKEQEIKALMVFFLSMQEALSLLKNQAAGLFLWYRTTQLLH